MSSKSVAERECLRCWEKIESCDLINVKDLIKFRDSIAKLHQKCEELRKSRDNWRAKYEEEKRKKG